MKKLIGLKGEDVVSVSTMIADGVYSSLRRVVIQKEVGRERPIVYTVCYLLMWKLGGRDRIRERQEGHGTESEVCPYR